MFKKCKFWFKGDSSTHPCPASTWEHFKGFAGLRLPSPASQSSLRVCQTLRRLCVCVCVRARTRMHVHISTP